MEAAVLVAVVRCGRSRCGAGGCGVGGQDGGGRRRCGVGRAGSLLVLAVVPVMLLVLAGQEVGEAVSLALEQPDEVVGTVVTLLQCQPGVVHLLLCGHHDCGEW